MTVEQIIKKYLTDNDFDGLAENEPPDDGDCCGCFRECLGDRCNGEKMIDCHPAFLSHSFEDGDFWFVFPSRAEFKTYLANLEEE